MIKLNQKKILSDIDIDHGYDLIRNKFLQIKSIFPTKYRELNIEYVVLPKVTSIYTLINNNYLNYLTYKKNNNPFLINLFKVYLNNIFNKSKKKYFNNLDFESNLDFLLRNSPHHIYDKKYNLFFINMGSYLSVVQKYISKSKLNNNKIIITKNLFKSGYNDNKFIIFEDFLTNEIIDEYKECKDNFKNCFLENQEYLSNLFEIDQINFFKCSYNGFKNAFEKIIPEAFLHLRILDNIFANIDVGNIITVRNRRIFDRAVNLKSHLLNKNNYLLLHSNIGYTSKFINEMGHLKYIKNAFVWNNNQSTIMKKAKYTNISNYYDYGSPLFDSITKDNNTNVDPKNIFIPGGTTKYSKKLIYNLVNNPSINIKYKITIKYHPNDSSKQFSKFKKKKNIELFNQFDDITKIISKTKLVITDISESSILAMILNKPVFFVYINDSMKSLFKDIYNFEEKESDYFCFNSMNKLLNSIDIIMNDNLYFEKVKSIQNKFIKNYISKQNFDIDECSNRIDKILDVN